jgi:DMSO/TMAO reductase YedYZ molybdopterin-dependent catalytic subunit
MGERPKIVEKLPVHSSRRDKDTSSHVIRVDGLVGKKLELKIADLERLPQENLTDDFTCLEGWTVPGVRWTGVSLAAALSAAEPKPEARYVQIAAGEFGVSIDREVAERALLAIRVGDSILPPEHGGPVRLVVPGGECFTSIKWVDHIELRAEPGEDSAKKIALGRLPSRTPGKQ